MKQPVTGPIEDYNTPGKSSEVLLSADQPKDAAYIFRRLFQADRPMRITADYRGEPKFKVNQEFQRLIDMVMANPWTKAALLKVERDESTIVFHTGSVVVMKCD